MDLESLQSPSRLATPNLQDPGCARTGIEQPGADILRLLVSNRKIKEHLNLVRPKQRDLGVLEVLKQCKQELPGKRKNCKGLPLF